MDAYGWHFLGEDRRPMLGYEREPWKVGEKRSKKLVPQMCTRGYHASTSIDDAFYFLALNFHYTKLEPVYLCYVKIYGVEESRSDKIVGRGKEILRMLSPEETSKVCLRIYSILHIGKATKRNIMEKLTSMSSLYAFVRSTNKETEKKLRLLEKNIISGKYGGETCDTG